ncbi:MAG: thioesterase family protein [Pseudomonadota bacterium]
MFERAQSILFRHCDPAGIVFYPRFFEMINDTVEAYFAHLGHPFAALHQGAAVPTAAIEATFHAPARLGEELALRLYLTKLGRTSLSYRVESQAFSASASLVHTGPDLRPAPWPDDLHQKLKSELETMP